MADTGSGGVQPPKEMSTEKRLLLAFILMGVVMYAMPQLYRAFGPQPNKTQKGADQPVATGTAQTGSGASASQAQAPAPEPAAAAAAPATNADATPQTPAAPVVIDTSLYRVVLNNQGATVRSWQLKRFKGNDGKPLELVNTAAGLEYPLSAYIPGQDALAKTLNWSYYKQEADPDGLGVAFDFSDGRVNVRKTLRFQKDSYISHIKVEVTSGGKVVPAMIAWRGGFGDFTITNPANAGRALFYNIGENKLVEQNSGAAKNGPVSSSGNYSFAGIADNYFAAVFLPTTPGAVRQTAFTHQVKTPYEQKEHPFVGVAVSDGGANDFEVFVGPKDLDQFRRINPKLDQLVDFGWWSFLAKPLFLITNWLNDRYVHNFGWAIVVVTIIINFVLFPLKLSSFKSMKKMSALKPQIDAINEKYKSIGIRDPRKAEQNQEMMDLYKKNGVNPMGGCFPMALQLPFFFAFYKVFNVSAEMRGATWLWVTDLSQPEHLPIKVLPLAMIASQVLMQKMTPQTTMDPKQQRLMYIMPLALGFMFYYFPSGLVLYYLTSNLVGLGQQWFFNRTATPGTLVVPAVQPKKKNFRK